MNYFGSAESSESGESRRVTQNGGKLDTCGATSMGSDPVTSHSLRRKRLPTGVWDAIAKSGYDYPLADARRRNALESLRRIERWSNLLHFKTMFLTSKGDFPNLRFTSLPVSPGKSSPPSLRQSLNSSSNQTTHDDTTMNGESSTDPTNRNAIEPRSYQICL
jgi:hypothetical protein